VAMTLLHSIYLPRKSPLSRLPFQMHREKWLNQTTNRYRTF